MKNREFFLRRSLDALAKQTFRDFDVVISDNSEDKVLRDILYKEYTDLDSMWYFSPKKGMAPNTNYAIKKSEGDLVKVLYLDDYLAHENSLKEIVEAFEGDWLVSGCVHDTGNGIYTNPHMPKFSKEDMDNFIGSPSVLTIKNHGRKNVFFDEKMTWLLDLDYYKRIHNLHGPPVFLEKENVVIGLGEHQMTHILSDELKIKEVNYLKNKYEK